MLPACVVPTFLRHARGRSFPRVVPKVSCLPSAGVAAFAGLHGLFRFRQVGTLPFSCVRNTICQPLQAARNQTTHKHADAVFAEAEKQLCSLAGAEAVTAKRDGARQTPMGVASIFLGV